MKILVVDDEPELREILKDALTLEGLSVQTASGGKEALSLLAAQAFDVVLSDVRMPDGDGVELLKSMRSRGDQTPLLFMTGFATVGEAEALSLGAFKLIKKPFELDDILGLLQAASKSKTSK